MIIVLKQDAPKEKIHEFCTELEGMGLQINDSKGSDTHILMCTSRRFFCREEVMWVVACSPRR